MCRVLCIDSIASRFNSRGRGQFWSYKKEVKLTSPSGGTSVQSSGGGQFILLSQRMPTQQSSTGWGRTPAKAVDGNPNGMWSAG